MGYHKLAVLSIRYPKTIILLWSLFLIFFGFYASKLPTVLKDHGLLPDGDFAKVQQILSSDFHIPEDPVILLFENKKNVSPRQFQRFIQQTLIQMQGMDGLTEVVSPLNREGMLKRNFGYALLVFKQKSYEMKQVLDEIHNRLPTHSGISVKLTGKSAVQADVNRASEHDLRKAERIGIPVAFIILWLAFGGIVSAIIPIVIGVIGVAGTMGVMYWLGTELELSNFVLNVIPMVGLALSIDFALMLVSRFREELGKSAVEQALVTTMKTAGRAVVFSAASVFLGLAGILYIPLPIFTTVALGAMAVLIISVLLNLTFLPALLSILWPALKAENKTVINSKKTNIWYTLSRYVIRRPIRMGVLASILLISCFLPLSNMKLAIPDAASLPKDYDSRIAAESYQTHFFTASTSHVFIIAQGNAHSMQKEEWLKIYAFIQKVKGDPYVQQVDSVFSSMQLSPESLYLLFQKPNFKESYEPLLQQFVNENRMLTRVTLRGSSDSEDTLDWIRRWDQAGKTTDMNFLFGGEPKYQQEVFDAIFHHIKGALLFIFISNFLVLFIAFRSILIPLKTIVMNLMSLGASFGILAWIFEEGHLGIEKESIAIMIPVFIFGLVFGISMDYGVFLVSRIFEVYRQTKDNDRAVLIGLASTGKIITSAAAIMISVTGPFAFGDVVGVKQLGVGIAAAILIDATVVRMVLVPSLMRLLGKWNWWAPGWKQTE